MIGRDDLPIDITRDDLTIDDVAGLPEDFRYELLDGKIHETPPPLPAHQLILIDIVYALDPRARRKWHPTFSVSVAIGRHDEPRPDILAVHERSALRSPVPVSDVMFAGEVLQAWSEPVDRGYRIAGQCSGLQAGGEGPRGEGRQARAVR